VSLYKVIFLGLAVAGLDEETRLIKGLQRKFNLSPEKAESLIQRVPIVVKKGISREEMEKYVRAFEEIGGRVRIEEEPESLDISPEPPLEKRVEKPSFVETVVTCPQCGFEQPETVECTRCGFPISKHLKEQETARTYESQTRVISIGEKDIPAWESGEGFINAFFKTAREALFSPSRFFKKVASGTGYWVSLIYALICGALADYTNVFWIWLFYSMFSQSLPSGYANIVTFFSGIAVIFLLIILPFFEAFSLLIGSAVVHLCLMIVGGNKKGYEATFRTFAYANSARLFYIIPFSIIPFLIPLLYFVLIPLLYFVLTVYHLALIVIGIRECNEISTGRAILAVLLPPIIVIVVSILTAVFLGLFQKGMSV
jgi:ribosomal protein L37E